MRILPIGLLMVLGGCQSTGESAQALIEQLQFYEGDQGCVRLQAEIDLNPLPLVTTNAQMVYKKNTGEGAPDC